MAVKNHWGEADAVLIAPVACVVEGVRLRVSFSAKLCVVVAIGPGIQAARRRSPKLLGSCLSQQIPHVGGAVEVARWESPSVSGRGWKSPASSPFEDGALFAGQLRRRLGPLRCVFGNGPQHMGRLRRSQKRSVNVATRGALGALGKEGDAEAVLQGRTNEVRILVIER